MQESKQRRAGDTWPKSSAELGAFFNANTKEGGSGSVRTKEGSKNKDGDDRANELFSAEVQITKTWGADDVAREAKLPTRASRSPEQESMVRGMVCSLRSSATLCSSLTKSCDQIVTESAPVSHPSKV